MPAEKDENWQPKLDEECLWHPPYQAKGLPKPARRVLIVRLNENGTVQVKLTSGRYRAVKREVLGPL